MTDPEKIKTIAAMREAGKTEREIAAHFGVSRKMVWEWVRLWNAANPETPVPRPASRPSEPLYVTAARLHKERGLTTEQIAAEMGRSTRNVRHLLRWARDVGALPPLKTKRDMGGMRTWEHYAAKGAAPPLGHMRDIVNQLPQDVIERLMATARGNEPTLAHTVGRILKEHFDAQTDAR